MCFLADLSYSSSLHLSTGGNKRGLKEESGPSLQGHGSMLRLEPAGKKKIGEIKMKFLSRR
jgi:hypothetical protein